MRPLEGVRVLDLTRLLPGGACTWYLQGLGATVVKIEEPVGGDGLRALPPFMEDGSSAWFHALNAGKRSVALDLKRPDGVAALRALLARADVLVEGFRPGVLARLGLDPRALCLAFPRLVVASITGYGQDGPWADQPGHDLGYCSIAGVLALGARHDGIPDDPGIQVADVAAGGLGAGFAICAALFARERTGRGAWIDVSMAEGMLPFVGPVVAAMAESGRRPEPGSEVLTGGFATYGVYRCSDGKLVALAALEPKFWMAFQQIVGEQVAMDRAAIAAVFARRTRDEWVRELGPACVTPVLELDEVAAHPQHVARGAFAGEGRSQRVLPPAWFGRLEGAVGRAPALGEHTAEELGAVGVEP